MRGFLLILLAIILLRLFVCQERDARFDDFDLSVLPILKEFQSEMIKNDSIVQKKSRKNDSFHFLHARSFDKDLPFLSDKLRKDIMDISSQKKIGRIDYDRNCITFSIKSIGNSLLDDEWLELDLIYHDKKNKEYEPCVSRSYFSNTDHSNVKQIDTCWYLILTKKRRYIRG
jgi:hypothetical protein